MEICGPGPKVEELLKHIDIRTQVERETDNLLKLALIAAAALVIGQSCTEKIVAPELYQRFIAKDNYTQTIQNY